MLTRLDWLQRIYLGLVAPATIALAVLIPPLEAPDERAHLLRADAISHGTLLPVMMGPQGSRTGVGGAVDTALRDWLDRFTPSLAFDHISLLSRRSFRETMTIADQGAVDEVSHPNTAIYPPFLYFQSAATIGLARLAGLPVWTWLYVARLTNAAVAIAIIASLMKRMPSSRPALLILAALPIMVYQLATASADALLLPLALAFACLIARMFGATRPSRNEAIALALTLVALCVGKIAYLPFALLPPLAARAADGAWSRRARFFAGVSVVTVLLWAGWAWIIHDKVLTIRSDAAVSPFEQLRWMAGHPVMTLEIFASTLVRNASTIVQSTVGGRLANLSLVISKLFVVSSLLLMLLVLVLEQMEFNAPRWFGILVASVSLTIAGTILLLLYLQFNPVGNASLDGIQGRYFLPIIFLLVPFLPKLRMPRLDAALPVIAGLYATATSLYLVYKVSRSFWTA